MPNSEIMSNREYAVEYFRTFTSHSAKAQPSVRTISGVKVTGSSATDLIRRPHEISLPFCRPNQFRVYPFNKFFAVSTTCSIVKPNFSNKTVWGPVAPNHLYGSSHPYAPHLFPTQSSFPPRLTSSITCIGQDTLLIGCILLLK